MTIPVGDRTRRAAVFRHRVSENPPEADQSHRGRIAEDLAVTILSDEQAHETEFRGFETEYQTD